MGALLARLASTIDAEPRDGVDGLEAAVCNIKHRKAAALASEFALQIGGDRWSEGRVPVHRELLIGADFPPMG